MSSVDCESFGPIWQFLLHFFMNFREGEDRLHLQNGYRKVDLHWKSRVWVPKIHLRVARWSSYFVHIKYPWVLSIARVSDRSDNFYFIFHDFQGGERTDSSCKMTTERLQKGLFTLKIYVLGSETPLRVVGWSSYFVHMKYPWVLSIARVSDQSYNFYKLFHDFQVSEGSSLAMKRLQKAWFTLKIKDFGSEIPL